MVDEQDARGVCVCERDRQGGLRMEQKELPQEFLRGTLTETAQVA